MKSIVIWFKDGGVQSCHVIDYSLNIWDFFFTIVNIDHSITTYPLKNVRQIAIDKNIIFHAK